MTKKSFAKYILMIFILTTIGCSGLRFSQLGAGSKGFSPAKSGCVSGGSMEL